MSEAAKYKPRLLEYLNMRGVDLDTSKTPPVLRCPDPSHTDKDPSAVVYSTAGTGSSDCVYCPVCATSWDIFEVAGLFIGSTEFKDQKKDVLGTLGEVDNYTPVRRNNPTTTKKNVISRKPRTVAKYDTITIEEAREIYTRGRLEEITAGMNKGHGLGSFIKAWPYKNGAGMVELIDARFEHENGKKSVVSFYCSGGVVRMKSYPILIYGREHLAERPDAPVLIHEGAKSSDAGAAVLPDMVHITWNGGAKKAQFADWSILEGRTVYMWPDDDAPGVVAAGMIKEAAPHVQVCPPFLPAREIKDKGADIVEAIECANIDALRSHIFESKYVEFTVPVAGPDPSPPPDNSPVDSTYDDSNVAKGDFGEYGGPSDEPQSYEEPTSGFPFRMLGIGDDKHAHFIDRAGRHRHYPIDQLTEKKLITLAALPWWVSQYGDNGKMTRDGWLNAVDDVIALVNSIDFDLDNLRGRGAWREPDGRVCYHDGQHTTGEYDHARVFLRVPRVDIGIGDDQASPEICVNIRKVVERMAFATNADAMRALAWAVLAPFSGALPVRPSGLLTGPSGSGKSTLLFEVIRPLAAPFMATGQDSTVAGVRQALNHDACGVALDETEGGTEMKQKARNEFFSLMRVSYSEDAPDAYKGTQDQTGRSFKMKNMFLFASISPEIDEVADNKRMFRINMDFAADSTVETWHSIQDAITEHITEENCRAIRSRSWFMLPYVLGMMKMISPVVQQVSGMDSRSSMAEALLISAYFIIWNDAGTMAPEKIEEKIRKIYKLTPVDEARDETGEMVGRILDETLMIPKTHGEKKTIREILTCLYTREIDNEKEEDNDSRDWRAMTRTEIGTYRRLAGQYGLGLLKGTSSVAISINHHEIRRITGKGSGYHHTLYRHANYMPARDGKKLETCNIGGGSKQCVIISGLLEAPGDVPFD